MKLLGFIVVGLLLLLVGPAVHDAAAGDACWQFDNFPTDFIKADIKSFDFDPKKLVAAFWRIIVCPGGACLGGEHPNRIYMSGAFQPDLNHGSKVMTLVGSVQDDFLNQPFVYQCFLHIKFSSLTLNDGDASGGCPLYTNFGVFAHEPISRVPCFTVPND
jgi:hypothetical protein